SNVHAAGLRQSKATNVQLMYNDEYGPFTGLFDILPLHIGVMGDVFAYGSKKEARTVRTQLGNCLYAIRKAILDEFEGLRVGQESEGYGRRST
ncbi:MAG: hypothetical protein KKE05_02325, partial [Nanoarchaeota archaeon]|nr:hypothetical protein [Nanoarchaeota archaeon]